MWTRRETGGGMLLLSRRCFIAVFASSLCCIGPAEGKDWREWVLPDSEGEMRLNQQHVHIQYATAPLCRAMSAVLINSILYLLHCCLSYVDLEHVFSQALHTKQNRGNERSYRKYSCSWKHSSYPVLCFLSKTSSNVSEFCTAPCEHAVYISHTRWKHWGALMV